MPKLITIYQAVLDGYDARLQTADRRHYGRPLIEADLRSFHRRFHHQLCVTFPAIEMTKK